MVAAMTKSDSNIDGLSFEQALAELEKIVRTLESGKAGLEESIQSYERGQALRAYCESKLKDAQLRVDSLTLNNAGKPETKEFTA